MPMLGLTVFSNAFILIYFLRDILCPESLSVLTDLVVPPGLACAGVRGVQLEALHDAEELVQVEVGGRLARRDAQHVLRMRPWPRDHGARVRGLGGAQGVHWQRDQASPRQRHGHRAWVGGGRRQEAGVRGRLQQRFVHLEMEDIRGHPKSDLKHTQQSVEDRGRD